MAKYDRTICHWNHLRMFFCPNRMVKLIQSNKHNFVSLYWWWKNSERVIYFLPTNILLLPKRVQKKHTVLTNIPAKNGKNSKIRMALTKLLSEDSSPLLLLHSSITEKQFALQAVLTTCECNCVTPLSPTRKLICRYSHQLVKLSVYLSPKCAVTNCSCSLSM